jgi:hypothetical protein
LKHFVILLQLFLLKFFLKCTKFFQTRKNCRRIVKKIDGARGQWVAGKNCGKNLHFFYDSSPTSARTKMFPQFFPGRRRARKVFLQFFHNSCPAAVFHVAAVYPCKYPCKETKIPRQFCERIVEEFGACQIRGRIFLTAAD